MTKNDKERINALQNRGFGYKRIATETGLPVNSVKSYCRRHPIDRADENCEYCKAPLIRIPHKKEKRFCSDSCRMAWWKAHPHAVIRKKLYHHTCESCGQAFDSPRLSSRFCSRRCYADNRRKEYPV